MDVSNSCSLDKMSEFVLNETALDSDSDDDFFIKRMYFQHKMGAQERKDVVLLQ